MMQMYFDTFTGVKKGRVLTSDGRNAIVRCRNPYGSHNLLWLEWSGWGWENVWFDATEYGWEAVVSRTLDYCREHGFDKKSRKFIKVLMNEADRLGRPLNF